MPRLSGSAGAARVPIGARRRVALAALAALGLLYAILAAAPATPGSKIVLATAGGSPDWLLGPLRFAGWDAMAGDAAGWTYFALLLGAAACYIAVAELAAELGARVVTGSIVVLHVLFLLAPPILSQDVFSYIAYARLGELHNLNPYAHAPAAIAQDPVYPFAGSKGAVSVYGPVFTLATYPLAHVGVPAAFWTLKVTAALGSLGIVALVWRAAGALNLSAPRAGAIAGLSPLTLVHVVGGAHNEAIVMLAVTAAIYLAVAGRDALGAAAIVGGGAIKASAGLVLPFLLAGSAQRGRIVAASAAAGLAAIAIGALGFGADALDAFGLISSNQGRSSRFSAPHKLAQLAAPVVPGGNLADLIDIARIALLAAFVAIFAWLLVVAVRSRSQPGGWIAPAGWATLAALVGSAWLVPWYLLWLLPLTALSDDRRLRYTTYAFSAYSLAIAIPF